jgi:hypothetical protein
MQILASILISAVMVLGSLAYTQETKAPALGASQTISSLTAGTSLDDADTMAYVDNSGTPTTKKITWGNATSTLKTFYDTIYSPIFSTSAGFFALISDETGSSGGVVRATSPTITTATLSAPTLDVAGSDATGDLYYNGGSGLLTRLPIGANQKYLMASTTGLAEWSSDYILTNPQTSSSTFTATTSFNGSSLTNNAIIINSLAYQFPSAHATGTLKNNGSGTLSWGHPIKITNAIDPTDVTTGYATSTILTIPAGLMTASSTIVVDWGGTSLYNGTPGVWYLRNASGKDIAQVSCGPGVNGNTLYCHGTLTVMFNSATSQRYASIGHSVYGAGTVESIISGSGGTASVDFTGEVTLYVVAYAPNASNSMNLDAFIVHVNP